MDEYEDDDFEKYEDKEFELETGYFDFSTFRQEDDYEIVTVSQNERNQEFILWLGKATTLLIIFTVIPFGIFILSSRDGPTPVGIALFTVYTLCMLGVYIRSFYRAIYALKTPTRETLTALGTKRFQEIDNYYLYYEPEEQRHQRTIQILFISTGLYLFTTFLLLPQSDPTAIFLALLPTFPYTWACYHAYLTKTSTPEKIQERYWRKKTIQGTWWYRLGSIALLLIAYFSINLGISEEVSKADKYFIYAMSASYIILSALSVRAIATWVVGLAIFITMIYGFYIAFQFAPIATTIVATLILGAIIIIKTGKKRETL